MKILFSFKFLLIYIQILLIISCIEIKGGDKVGIFSKLFNEKLFKKNISVKDEDKFYEEKEKGLENILGKPEGLVGHAIIPFDVGGAVDMYYYSNHIEGTAFVTMELIKPDGTGPKPNRNGTFELIAFTKEKINDFENKDLPFNKIERRFCGIFTSIGNYSFQAKLEPGETCEIPNEKGNIYMVFDEYKPDGKDFLIGNKKHGLLLIIEIFKDELDFARENGSKQLIQKLKEKNIYPYSDMNRESVLK